jgi:hypothetical protein
MGMVDWFQATEEIVATDTVWRPTGYKQCHTWDSHGFRKRWSWINSRYYPVIRQVKLGKIMKGHGQDSQYTGFSAAD